MKKFSDFQNYVFDLYGTLIDVRTDEASPRFWQKLAEWYAVFGADYRAEALQTAYLRCVREEEDRLREGGNPLPEIELETVFLRLLHEAPGGHAALRAPSPGEEKRWVFDTANLFRILSRDRFAVFPGAESLLAALKAREKKVYMLSNAQEVFTLPEIEQSGLLPFFDRVFLSSARSVKKPERGFFSALLREENLSVEETVMIGNDAYADMAIACAVGASGIWVHSDPADHAARRAAKEDLARRFGDDAVSRIGEAESLSDLLPLAL